MEGRSDDPAHHERTLPIFPKSMLKKPCFLHVYLLRKILSILTGFCLIYHGATLPQMWRIWQPLYSFLFTKHAGLGALIKSKSIDFLPHRIESHCYCSYVRNKIQRTDISLCDNITHCQNHCQSYVSVTPKPTRAISPILLSWQRVRLSE